MDLALQCQISSHPTAVISALIIAKELRLTWDSTAQDMLRISRPPDDSYICVDVQELDMVQAHFFHYFTWTNYYWEFLDHPGRCGILYNERAKCYTRIVSFWLLFLETTPDPEGSDSLDHEKCRELVLANWSRFLSKCVPGDKDLICRLRDFTLDNTWKEDVERVMAWLKVSLQCFFFLVIFTCVMRYRWTQIYRKMSSFAGKPTASNGIRCVVG